VHGYALAARAAFLPACAMLRGAQRGAAAAGDLFSAASGENLDLALANGFDALHLD
jgi:hypothetical protein